jgi:hypothetical protein
MHPEVDQMIDDAVRGEGKPSDALTGTQPVINTG